MFPFEPFLRNKCVNAHTEGGTDVRDRWVCEQRGLTCTGTFLGGLGTWRAGGKHEYMNTYTSSIHIAVHTPEVEDFVSRGGEVSKATVVEPHLGTFFGSRLSYRVSFKTRGMAGFNNLPGS